VFSGKELPTGRRKQRRCDRQRHHAGIRVAITREGEATAVPEPQLKEGCS